MKSFLRIRRWGKYWGPIALLMALLGGSGRLFAQAVANAQLSGVISDSTGAVVPGAKVTATQTNTGLIRTALSTANGTYVLPNLPIGPYRLEVAAGGFATYVRTGILLQVSNNLEINVTLQLGQVTQEVKVSADASMVQTQSTSIGQVIDQTRMLELPLNGRLATQLVMLSGASYNTQNSALVSSKNYSTSMTISVAGGQVNGTNYLMDGGDNNNAFTNVNMPFPFPDAVQEFSVQTSGLAARSIPPSTCSMMGPIRNTTPSCWWPSTVSTSVTPSSPITPTRTAPAREIIRGEWGLLPIKTPTTAMAIAATVLLTCGRTSIFLWWPTHRILPIPGPTAFLATGSSRPSFLSIAVCGFHPRRAWTIL